MHFFYLFWLNVYQCVAVNPHSSTASMPYWPARQNVQHGADHGQPKRYAFTRAGVIIRPNHIVNSSDLAIFHPHLISSFSARNNSATFVVLYLESGCGWSCCFETFFHFLTSPWDPVSLPGSSPREPVTAAYRRGGNSRDDNSHMAFTSAQWISLQHSERYHRAEPTPPDNPKDQRASYVFL